MLWNIGIIVLLLWLERHRKLRRGMLLGLYAVLYAVGRFLLELIRTDSPSRYFGLSRNGWYSLVVILAGSGLLIWLQRRKPAPEEEEEEETAAEVVDGEAGEESGEFPRAEGGAAG